MAKKVNLHRLFAAIMLSLMLLTTGEVCAQKIVSIHKVQKQETVFGIAKDYGVTIDELSDANPDMRQPDFVLKKGMSINIPEHHGEPLNKQTATPAPAQPVKTTPAQTAKPATAPVQQMPPATVKAARTYTIGVMLPLHDINGDGRRMTEYYRGLLMGVSELKHEGFNITVNAWNVPEGDDLSIVLRDPKAAKCDIIFGPLYTTQVKTLADFCTRNGIRLVIPFSINGDDVQTCKQIYQVYQRPADITEASIKNFLMSFADAHPVFIDCNDVTSKKGDFTFGLRKQLEARGIPYSITNLNNSSGMFMQAFSPSKRNVVILNTGRSPELGQAFAKLDEMTAYDPSFKICMFGYNEWFMYTKIYQDKFSKYEAYVPSVYDYNNQTDKTRSLEKLYETYFKAPMMQNALPRFALTGYDHMMFFLKGMDKYGPEFHGYANQSTYSPVQTPLMFERLGYGGYQNRAFMLVHFK